MQKLAFLAAYGIACGGTYAAADECSPNLAATPLVQVLISGSQGDAKLVTVSVAGALAGDSLATRISSIAPSIVAPTTVAPTLAAMATGDTVGQTVGQANRLAG